MARRILLSIVLSCSILAATAAHAAPLRLCGSSQVREGSLQPSADGSSTFHITWTWEASKSEGIPKNFVYPLSQIDDCKPSIDGKEMLVSSSRGAIAIVSYPDGKTLFYAAVPNAHSIELLPNGIVAAASSTHEYGNRLIFFDRAKSDTPLFSMPLPAAHGVTWDSKRNTLWALGDDVLLQLRVTRDTTTNIHVEELKRYPLPNKNGHDLVLSQDASVIYITTVPRPFVFDIGKETFSDFAPLAGIRNVKSLSMEPTTHQLAYTIADGGEKKAWWTFTLRFQNPSATAKIEVETYKVRWAVR